MINEMSTHQIINMTVVFEGSVLLVKSEEKYIVDITCETYTERK